MTPQQRNEHFREALARAIAEAVEFPRDLFVTVLEANLSPSQHDAIATLSVLPAGRDKEVLRALATYRSALKETLAQALRLRHIPFIQWKFDATGAYVETIDATIAELKKKGDL
ncbi:MAG: ribosome-binding factor A [Patescibacteria group bacterium]